MKKNLMVLAALSLALASRSPARADFVLGVAGISDPAFRGATVTGVTNPSAARDVGIRVGDVIYQCNDSRVYAFGDLQDAVERTPLTPDNSGRKIIVLSFHRTGGPDRTVTAVVVDTFDGGTLVKKKKVKTPR